MNESQSNDREWVRQIDLGITWDPNAPYPCLLQTDHHAFLILNLFDDTPLGGDPTTVNANLVGVIEWKDLYASLMGPPNHEAISGHRLWDRGLRDVLWAGEVLGSNWVRSLERMNAVHPRHDPRRYEGLRHFVLRFKESTFECVARGFVSEKRRGPISEVSADIIGRMIGS
jgi:hypothetical protein